MMSCLGAPDLAPISGRAADCDRGRASILAGRTRFDRESAGQCLDALAAMSCDAFFAAAAGGYPCPDHVLRFESDDPSVPSQVNIYGR
jgi:hypothetical protein